MGFLAKRRQLIELQDLPWLPSSIRNGVTDYLQFTVSTLNLYAPAEAVVLDLFQRAGTHEVVDLCSGGAGPHRELRSRLAQATGKNVVVTLTDKFPNVELFRRLEAGSRGTLRHLDFSVDARAVPAGIHGVRTLFTALHHFTDADARAILRDAFEKRRPIAVFEFTERRWVNLLAAIPTPLWMFLFTPLLRPWKVSRFFWTYVIPAIPAVAWWDITVSILRTRDERELHGLLTPLQAPDYEWRVGRTPTGFGMGVIYLTGCPRKER